MQESNVDLTPISSFSLLGKLGRKVAVLPILTLGLVLGLSSAYAWGETAIQDITGRLEPKKKYRL